MCTKTVAYLQALFASTEANALPSPVWNSRLHFNLLWESRVDEANAAFGTVSKAIATLDECKKTFTNRPLVRSSRAEKPFCCLIEWLHDGFVMMHPHHVLDGADMCPKYTIEVAELSHLQKEAIEDHDQILFVLRYRGAIVSAFISVKVHVDSRERVSLL